MDAIAQAAGVSKPVIYDCFASKAKLFGALLDREEQRMLAQFSEAMASSARSNDLPTMLESGFVAMLRAVDQTPELYRIALFGSGEAEAAIEARVRHGRGQQVRTISALARAWLTDRLSAEDRRPDEALDHAARFAGETLVALGEAGVRTMLGSPGVWTPELLGGTLARLATAGFAALLDARAQPAEGDSDRG